MANNDSDENVPAENVTDVVSPDHVQHLRLLEALIFAGTQALDEKELADRLPNDADVARLLADLGELYAHRGVNLVKVAGGYAFRTAPDLSEKLKIERPVGRRRVPGRPVTWGTTDFFLEHFGLPSLEDLPGHEEMKAAGLLDGRAQPPIFRPDEPDLPLEAEENEADEPLATEEQGH